MLKINFNNQIKIKKFLGASLIIFPVPIVLFSVFGLIREGSLWGILGGIILLPVLNIGLSTGHWAENYFQELLLNCGPFLFYFFWTIISCLLVFGYWKIKNRKRV